VTFVGYAVTIFSAILAAVGIVQLSIRFFSKKTSFHKLVMAIVHDRLFYLLPLYLDRGYITKEEMLNIKLLFDPYKDCGGNGHIDVLMHRNMQLPLRMNSDTSKLPKVEDIHKGSEVIIKKKGNNS